MACRGTNKRYAAIYDVILNYMETQPDGRKTTINDIVEYFANDPTLKIISKEDILNALTQMRPDMIVTGKHRR